MLLWFLWFNLLTPTSDQTDFSLHYQYNIQQNSDKNKEKYQLGDKLIQYQILQTNIIRTVWQTVRRIANVILGVERLKI